MKNNFVKYLTICVYEEFVFMEYQRVWNERKNFKTRNQKIYIFMLKVRRDTNSL